MRPHYALRVRGRQSGRDGGDCRRCCGRWPRTRAGRRAHRGLTTTSLGREGHMDMLLTGIPWSYLGPGTVLLVAILAIIRGDLVPRRQHEEVIRLHQQAAERERSTATQALSAL